MSRIRLQRFTCLQMVLYLSTVAASGQSPAVVTSQFVLLTNPYLKFVPLGVELSGVDRFTCARQCVLRNNSCFNFNFNELLNTCSLGSWPASSPVAISHVNTYMSTQTCNPTAKYTLQQSGDVRVCVRISATTSTFFVAEAACKEFGGNLYTPKTSDKLNILKTFGNRNVWVGLDDIQKEGEFRWADDDSVVSKSWMSTIFNTNEPNGGASENCGAYNPSSQGLNDVGCATLYGYLCEMPELIY